MDPLRKQEPVILPNEPSCKPRIVQFGLCMHACIHTCHGAELNSGIYELCVTGREANTMQVKFSRFSKGWNLEIMCAHCSRIGCRPTSEFVPTEQFTFSKGVSL